MATGDFSFWVQDPQVCKADGPVRCPSCPFESTPVHTYCAQHLPGGSAGGHASPEMCGDGCQIPSSRPLCSHLCPTDTVSELLDLQGLLPAPSGMCSAEVPSCWGPSKPARRGQGEGPVCCSLAGGRASPGCLVQGSNAKVSLTPTPHTLAVLLVAL